MRKQIKNVVNDVENRRQVAAEAHRVNYHRTSNDPLDLDLDLTEQRFKHATRSCTAGFAVDRLNQEEEQTNTRRTKSQGGLCGTRENGRLSRELVLPRNPRVSGDE